MNRNCQKGKKKLIIYSLTSLFILHSLISKVETSCFKDVYIKNKIYTYAEKAVLSVLLSPSSHHIVSTLLQIHIRIIPVYSVTRSVLRHQSLSTLLVQHSFSPMTLSFFISQTIRKGQRESPVQFPSSNRYFQSPLP